MNGDDPTESLQITLRPMPILSTLLDRLWDLAERSVSQDESTALVGLGEEVPYECTRPQFVPGCDALARSQRLQGGLLRYH